MSSDVWTMGRLLDWTVKFLADKGAESPRLDAEVLLAHCAQCKRIELYTRYEEVASEPIRNSYKNLVRQRVEGCPVAYLVGHKEFYSLKFQVAPSVLIPRPETEILVMEAIRIGKAMTLAPKVIDIGTGSGAIAVAVAKHLPMAQVLAVDLSADALELAKSNANSHQLGERIRFQQSDLFSTLPADQKFDLVLSNPPYIASEVLPTLPTTVIKYEPRIALDGGAGGLSVIDRLLQQATKRLEPGGTLLVEIGSDQGLASLALAEKYGFLTSNIIYDEANHPRVLRCRALKGKAN